MDDGQLIANADSENRHGRPKDSLTLILTVLVHQHEAIQDLDRRLGLLEAQVAGQQEAW